MRQLVFLLLKISGLPFLFREFFQRSKVTILCYHKLDARIAEKTFPILQKKYNIIDLNLFIKASSQNNAKLLPKKSLIITVDDGYLENYSLLNYLKKNKIPLTIFLCAELIDTKRKLWFEHQHPEFDLFRLQNIPNEQRLESMEQMGFVQEKTTGHQYMLTASQILEMKEFVNFQSHTLFHPCLPTCSDLEANKEITHSKELLEEKFSLDINALAYPNGDYSERDIKLVKDAGYKCAVTLDFGFNTVATDLFRLKRLGVNDSYDLNELLVKASGVWGFFKTRNGKKQHYGLKKNIQ